MQSVKKDIRNVREADSITTLSNDQSSHKCGYQHQVYPNVTIAYNTTTVFYKVKQCSAIPSALQWVEVTDITLAVEQGGSVNCVKHIKHENSSYIVVGGESSDKRGIVWIISIKSGRLIRNCFTTKEGITTLSCYTSPSLLSSPGLVLVLGTRQCHVFILHLNPLTSPNSKQKHLLPTTFLDDISTTTLGSTTHPCFEVGAKTRVKGAWNYMLPGMKSAGVFRDATVSSVELLDSMGCIVVGYSNGGWQIWSVAGSKAVLQFTSSLQPDIYPVTNFSLLVPENDPHHILYLWVTHSGSNLPADTTERQTTATMYQLRFRNKVVGTKPGVNDQYRRIESLIQSFTFNLSQPLFIGKESGVFKQLVDFEAIQRMNYLQGCHDFNGVVISLDTTKYIITVLFDLNAWYFAQMPGSLNQVARLSPYIAFLPLEKTSMPSYCCLQAVKVKSQSLFRGKLSSSEACNVFPCSLNTIVRYHIGKNIVNAFYFPTNELVSDPGNTVQGLVSLALKGIFTKHNSLVHSKKGRLKVLEFLTTFLPDLKNALNEAMSPMLSGLPTGDTELKNLRELISVTSHCIHLGNKLSKQLPDRDSYRILYQHTYQYARTVLALTDMSILPASYSSLQQYGCRMLPLRYTAIGELLSNVTGLTELWEDEMFPPQTIRSLLNVFYTKPLDLKLQGYIVAYSVLYLNKEDVDIQNLNMLSREDADAISSIYHLDQRDYKKFIKHLPSKSGVFVYCDINSICDILVQQKKRDVAIQMLMVLDESYVCHYSPRTMSLLADMLSSEYKINLISSGGTDLLAFSTVLDEQLSHKQFVALMKSLDNQERFDCLFYLILKKNKLCDLLSAYGETKHSQKSSSQFLEFMFLYTIKHFSDIELKASITACQGNPGDKEKYNKSIPLSAQKCQNDISVLSKFCLKTDLGNFKLGSSPKVKKASSDHHVARTPPPKVLDISDDLLVQLRTPHPTPLKDKVLTALEAPRSILRSSKTERKNRKRIRFDDPSDALPVSKPTRLSFGAVEFSEPRDSSSPTKKLTFDDDMTLHEGVSLADISPPKPVIESVVQYDDTIGDDEQIPVPQELSNDSISFEIVSTKTPVEEVITPIPSETSEVAEISEIAEISPVEELPTIAEFSPITEEPSLPVEDESKVEEVLDESQIELSMEDSFVSAASSENLVQISEQQPVIIPDRDILVNSTMDDSVREPIAVQMIDSSLEEIATSPASPDPLPEYPEDMVSHTPARMEVPNVISLDSSNEIEEIESPDEEAEEEEGDEEDSEEDEEGEDEEAEDAVDEEEIAIPIQEGAASVGDDAHSERSAGSVQVIGIDSSHSDVEEEQNKSSSSVSDIDVPAEDTSGEPLSAIPAQVEGHQSDGSGSIQVIGIDSRSEESGDESGDAESGSGGESDGSDGEESSGPDPDEQNIPEGDQDIEAVVEGGAEVEDEEEAGSESSGSAALPAEISSPVEEGANSGTEADTESSDGEGDVSNLTFVTSEDEVEARRALGEPSLEKVIPEDEIQEIPDDDASASLQQVSEEESEESGDDEVGSGGEDTEMTEAVEPALPVTSDEEVQLIPSEDPSTAIEQAIDQGDIFEVESTDKISEITAPVEEQNVSAAESAVNVPEYHIEETGSTVMVLDTSSSSAKSEDAASNRPTSVIEQVSGADVVHVIGGDESSSTRASPNRSSEVESVNETQLPTGSAPEPEIMETDQPGELPSSQEEDSFVSADAEPVYQDADAGPSDVGQILESDDSDDEEEFVFEAPEQVVPPCTWFMETFPDHDKLSFDFNAPHRAAPATNIATRTRSKKAKAIGSEDVLPPPAPIIKIPSPPTDSFLVPPPAFNLTTPSEALSISTTGSAFSPELPLSVQAPVQSERQPPQIPHSSSPFTASLSQFIPERSVPKYQLSKTEDGTLKLQNVEPAPAPEVDVSGDTESLEGSEFQSFISTEENVGGSSEIRPPLAGEPEQDDVARNTSFQSIASDQTESLPSSPSRAVAEVTIKQESASVPSEKVPTETVSDQESSSMGATDSITADVTEYSSSIQSSTLPTSTESCLSGFAVISEPEIIAISEAEVSESLSTELNRSEEEQPPVRKLRSRNLSKESDSGVTTLTKKSEVRPRAPSTEDISEKREVNNDAPETEEIKTTGRRTRRKVTVEEPSSSATEAKPYKILRAPRLRKTETVVNQSTPSTTATRPTKILRAPRTLRSQKQIVDSPEDKPAPSRRTLRSRKPSTEKLAVETSSTVVIPEAEPVPEPPKSAIKSRATTRRGLRSKTEEPESVSPSKSSPDTSTESLPKPPSPVQESPPATRRTLRSKSDKTVAKSPPKAVSSPLKTSKSEPPKLEKSGRTLRTRGEKAEPSKTSFNTAVLSPPRSRRALRSKAETTEEKSPIKPPLPKQSPAKQSPARQSPAKQASSEASPPKSSSASDSSFKSPSSIESLPARRNTRTRSKQAVTESEKPSGKGKLRPRQHTTSDSNSEVEKPANKIRKSVSPTKEMRRSVSPRKDWVMPVSPNKTKPPPGPAVTVTRSSRRLRTQWASSEIVTETSALRTALSAEITPARSQRSTRRNNAGPSSTDVVSDTPLTRLTRTRKAPSETPSRSSSRQSSAPSEDSMPAKRSRGATVASPRRTRNVSTRAATSASASSVSEKRETRSTRKASGK